MEETVELWISGKITPVGPIKQFSITEVEQAFRYMSAGTHTGKIVITANPEPSNSDLVKVHRSEYPLIIHSNFSKSKR